MEATGICNVSIPYLKLALKDIKVKGRHRKDVGDLTALSNSIERLGLLHPLVIDSNHNLIAGTRRYAAVKDRGWSHVACVVCATADDALRALEAERDENSCREPLKPSEAVALGQAIEAIEGPKAAEKQKVGKAAIPSSNLDKGTKQHEKRTKSERTDEKAASASGMSRNSYRKAKAVVEAAKDDPELAEVVEEMDRTGKVDPAYKKVTAPKPTVKETKPTTDDPTDAEGHVIPEPIRAAFASVAKFKELDALCQKLQSGIDELSRLPGGEHLRQLLKPTTSGDKTINKSEHVNALKRDIKYTRPHSVCPWCQGLDTSCKYCNGQRWVQKLTWDGAEESIKERLK